MVRYVLLLNFTEQGISKVKDSTKRAEAFRKSIAKAGGTVESQTWTLGAYDGVVVFTAPDEATAVTLVLNLARKTTVRTTMLRAFDAAEFGAMTAQLT